MSQLRLLEDAFREFLNIEEKQEIPAVIQIREISTTLNLVGEATWKASVHCDEGRFVKTVEVKNPFNANNEENLEWYLEEFATSSPLSHSRAQDVSSSLRKYAAGLIKGFTLEEVVNHIQEQNSGGAEAGITFFLDVETLPSESVELSLHIIHWEILENLDLWPRGVEGRIVVRRKIAGLESRQSPPSGVANRCFNILLVAARNPASGEDELGRTLVAAELVKVLAGLPFETPVDLEIVRPGTWEMFKESLETKPRGYYRLVHFDMHGRVRVDKMAGEKAPSLCFVSDKDPATVTWKSASDVADLLCLHNVTSVILNACNSADASEESVALKFINRGVSAVVAMSHELMAGAVGSFMTGFYRSLLIDTSSFAVAAHAGRAKMMEQKMRESYGDRVPVEDHIVPAFYQRGEPAVIDWGVMMKLNMILLTKEPKAPMKLVGRELDILRLETLLLCGDGVAVVTGRRRVGKTAFLKHLCWWWNITGLVDHSQYINLEATGDTFSEILLLIYREAIGMPTILEMQMMFAPDARETAVYWRLVKWLQLARYMIVFDGVEHWKPELLKRIQPEDSTGPVFWNTERRALESFLEDVGGGETIVIVTAELNSPWVDIDPYILEGLPPYDMATLLPIELEKSNEKKALGPGADFMEFYTKLIELCDGLPGAVTELSRKLPLDVKENISERVYCGSLLAVPKTAGRYSQDCTRAQFVQSLIPPNSDEALNSDEATQSDLKRLIYIIAPFWGRIPKDVDDYLIHICFNGYFNHNDPDTLCLPIRRFDARNPRDLSPAEKGEAKELLARSKLRSEYYRIISSLQEKDYLTKDEFKPDRYYRINPVLTFALRGVMFGDGHLSAVAHASACLAAFLDYYKMQTLEDDWDNHIQFEKTNIYSTMITLSCLPPTLAGLSLLPVSPMVSLISMHQAGHGGSDFHVLEVISKMWIKAFDSFLATEKDMPLEAVFPAYKLAFHCSNYLCSRYRDSKSTTEKFMEQVRKSNEYSELSKQLPEGLREHLLIANFMAAIMSAQADAHRGLLPGVFVYETMGDVSGANRGAHELLESDPRINFQAEGNSDTGQDVGRLQNLRTLSLEFDTKDSRGWSDEAEKAGVQQSIKGVCDELRESAVKLGMDLACIDGWLAVHEARAGVTTLAETLSKLGKAESNGPSKHLPGSAIMEADIKRDSGDIAGAKEILLTALDHSREGGTAQGELLCHGRLQEIAYLTGQWDDVIAHNQRMIALVDMVHGGGAKEKRRADKAVLVGHSGLAHIHLRQWDEAIECSLYTIRICQEATVDDPNAFLLDRVQAEQLIVLRYLRFHRPDHKDLPSSAEIRRQQLTLQLKLDPATAEKMDDLAVRRMEEIKTQFSLIVMMSPRAQWAARRETLHSDALTCDGIPLYTRSRDIKEWWGDTEEDVEVLTLVKEYHSSFQHDPESALFGISLDESRALEGLLPGV